MEKRRETLFPNPPHTIETAITKKKDDVKKPAFSMERTYRRSTTPNNAAERRLIPSTLSVASLFRMPIARIARLQIKMPDAERSGKRAESDGY